MSRPLGLAVLDPRYRQPRIPVMEHTMGLSRKAILHFTGIDPIRQPHRVNEAFLEIARTFEIDLLWGGGLPTSAPADRPELADQHPQTFDWDDGQTVKKDRAGLDVVQWGIFGAAHQEDGRHFTHIPKPASLDEALDFDPLRYFPKTVEQYRDEFTAAYQRMLDSCGDACVPLPHHYTTCFHWPLAIFGFELLCEAGMEEDRFHALIDRFALVTQRIAQAWAAVPGLQGFILHDDLAMTSGPIFAPDWYRRHIFPHYPRFFAPFRDAGIPLIFTSDGNCSDFVDDIFAAGADGLNFEYLLDLADIARRYPDKILIGNINSATIARGSPEQIRSEVTACINAGSACRRFVVNVGGGLTADMPPENLQTYLDLRRQLCRIIRPA